MGEPIRALVVEDSENDALLLVKELERGGYEVTAKRVDTVKAVTDALAKEPWNIIFSDYTMPHFRGTDALELLRKSGLDIPFIFVSGTIGEETAAAAMKAGAHDYVVKDNLKRLVPAVQRELRQAQLRQQRKRAEEQARQKQQCSQALLDVNLAVHSSLELRTIASLFLETIGFLLPYPVAMMVTLLDRRTGGLEPLVCWHVDNSEWMATTLRTPHAAIKAALESKTPVVVRNARLEPRTPDSPLFLRKNGLVSYCGAPLVCQGEVLGLLSVYTREEHHFSKEEVEFFAAVSGQAATAMHRAQLFEQTKNEAAALARFKDEFLRTIAEQLKPSLEVVIEYVVVLREGTFGALTPLQEEVVEKVIASSRELLNLVDRVLRGPAESEKAKNPDSEMVKDS